MQMTAIISEYNPFHNGHHYQASVARKETGADVVVAIMSGTFMQRGEPAFLDKWSRAKAAVASGAIDLVIELPFYFAVQRADRFASGGVSIAETIGAQTLSFGSESGETAAFEQAARLDVESTVRYRELIGRFLKEGKSSAKAASDAFAACTDVLDLTTPNNTLGYYYARAAQDITMHTTKRIGSGYHDLSIGDIMSATAIRARHQQTGELLAVPEATRQAAEIGKLSSYERYYPVIRNLILTAPQTRLEEINDIDSSLAPRLRHAALVSGSFEEFVSAVKTRRYTRTHIQRALVYLMTQTTKQEIESVDFDSVDFIRPLAFNRDGRTALRSIKKRIHVMSTFTPHPWLTKESQVTAAYALPLASLDALQEHRQIPYFTGSDSR
ncbi:tRNA(Met) cytidine acetate ligase [Exiguobacterium flavidum]|uniref:tRNA(Met) cytidine acetate ligase n=1 Tax=Exiguobacterium flavidum TaxID=2184695 RepID=UPI000DF754B8|nr:nucleotidyltransferase family protein [Exiguobacterium flavidum]